MAVTRTKGLIKVSAVVPSTQFSTLKAWFTLPSTQVLQTSYLQYAFVAVPGSGRETLQVFNSGVLPFSGQSGVSYSLSYVG